jgi:DNA adenine methylase
MHHTIRSDKFRSPLRYPGGKQKAVTQIAKYLPSSANEYREPLVGGGSIYFYAKSINFAKNYWLNDAFTELVSFWQTVQNSNTCRNLIHDLEKLRLDLPTAEQIKEYYYFAKEECPKDNYRQALLFFFFNRVSFSGTTKAGGFSSAASLLRFTDSSIQRLTTMPEALANVKITNYDFEEVIKADGKDVFIFLDPPYFTAKKLYGHKGGLHAFDHEHLANILKKTKHKFLITYDDCPTIRDLYKWAKISNWNLQYGMTNCNSNRQSKIGAELFVSNY